MSSIKPYQLSKCPNQADILISQKRARKAYSGEIVKCDGKISVVILSCKRKRLLQKTCESLFKHIDTTEPNVDLEYILVDNGSGKDLISWAETQRFDKIFANKKNLGIGGGLNQGFAAATGEFIFQLEDDWICNTEQPLLQQSTEVLREFDDIGIVRLKQNELTKGTAGRSIGPTRFTSSGLKVYPWFPTKQPCGAYCFGCGIFKRQAFKYTGLVPYVHYQRAIEWAYARQFEKYYNGARVEGLLEAFVHIGGRKATSGWKDKI